jgi:hypothetical protein
MNMTRTGLGVLVGLLTAMSLLACGTANDDAPASSISPSSTGPAAIRQELVRASDAVYAGPYHVDVTASVGSAGSTLSADADPAKGVVRASTHSDKDPARNDEYIIIGAEMWMKRSQALGRIPAGRWLHVDLTTRGLSPDTLKKRIGAPDRSALQQMLTVERTGAGEYSGTMSAKGLGGQLGAIADETLDIRFTATVRDGRLTVLNQTITVDTTRLPASTGPIINRQEFSAFGTPVTVTRPPAGQVSEAPKELYDLLT